MTGFADLKHQMDLLNGYLETGGNTGHDGNVTKLWADVEPSLQGQPWCACTDCYIWKHAGHPYPAIDHPWGFSYCPDAVAWAKRHGLWDTSGHYAPGDTIFYDFTGHGVAEHTGTVVSDDGHTILTFEGNTSPDGGFGSQADGGGSFYRHRQHGPSVLGVLKSSRWLTAAASVPARHAPIHNPHHLNPHDLPLKEGSRGPSVAWAQWALSVPDDGDFGPRTAAATALWKRVHHLPHPDPVIRQFMAASLMRVTH